MALPFRPASPPMALATPSSTTLHGAGDDSAQRCDAGSQRQPPPFPRPLLRRLRGEPVSAPRDGLDVLARFVVERLAQQRDVARQADILDGGVRPDQLHKLGL